MTTNWSKLCLPVDGKSKLCAALLRDLQKTLPGSKICPGVRVHKTVSACVRKARESHPECFALNGQNLKDGDNVGLGPLYLYSPE